MSSIVDKYCKEVKKNLPTYGKNEKELLNNLKQQGLEILNDNPDMIYEAFVREIGSPNEVIVNYFGFADNDELLKKLNNKKLVKRCIIIVTVVLLLIVGYAAFRINQSINESERHRAYEIEYTIEED